MSVKRFFGTYLYETTSVEAQLLRKHLPGVSLREVVLASDYEALERHRAVTAMTWTTQKPTKPGLYWLRAWRCAPNEPEPSSEWCVVQVWYGNDDGERNDELFCDILSKAVTEMHGYEWSNAPLAGPLEPPQ